MRKMMLDFTQIKFNPTYHTYTYANQRLTNVTKLVSQVKRPFDRDGISKKKADEKGIPQEFILAEWEESGRRGRELGSRVHRHIEQVLRGTVDLSDPILQLNDQPAEILAFETFWAKASSNLTPYRIEWVVGDAELGIAGTIDTVTQHGGTGQYHLFDWKTGKLEHESGFGKMLPPFDDLDDCALNHYSLQLSIYTLILRRNADLNPGASYLVHLTDQCEIIKAIDLTERAEAWLKERARELFS